MKNNDKLKILAMESCLLNDELSFKNKKKHLKYIKEESSSYQCIGYILDGKFYNLTTEGKQELKKRFLKEQGYHPYRKTFFAHAKGPTGAVIAGVGTGLHTGSVKKSIIGGTVGLAKWAGYRLIRGQFD
jgi:hypothetical protein